MVRRYCFMGCSLALWPAACRPFHPLNERRARRSTIPECPWCETFRGCRACSDQLAQICRGNGSGRVAGVAVFDLDGTLLDGDSTSLWLRERILRSMPRRCLAILLVPIAGPLLLIPRLRRIGASLMVWVATAGLN